MNRRLQSAASAAGLVLLTLLLIHLPAQGATPAEYDAALAQVQTAIDRQVGALKHGAALPAAQAPAAVAARVLTPLTVLERTGQPPQPIDDSLLVTSIRAADGTRSAHQHEVLLQDASSQVGFLRHDLAVGNVSIGPDPASAGDVARAVLSGGVYEADPLPPPSLFDRFINWLDREIQRLLRALTPHGSASMPDVSPTFIRTIVIILAVGAFAVLVAVLVQWLRNRPVRVQPLALDETEAALVEARDTDSLRALADQKAQSGDYRMALRLIYLALLVALDSGGVLRFDRSKTNWEYLRALRASGQGDVYDAMTPLTRDFDRIWYGFAAADAADYTRAVIQYDALQVAPTASASGRTSVAA
jgi:hypothetical protein